MKQERNRHIVATLTALVLLLASLAAAPPPGVEYTRDVQPILTRSCLSCHGPQKQRGGLRLDTAAGLRQGGDSGLPVVPGDSTRSRLYQMIAGTTDRTMPPKGPRLAVAEIAS